MTQKKPRATRTATGDWDYRGFTISQCYRTRRWVACKKDETPGEVHAREPVYWAQTLRSAKFRIDCFWDDCPDAHTCRHGIDN